jgi:predicted dehydrogenase
MFRRCGLLSSAEAIGAKISHATSPRDPDISGVAVAAPAARHAALARAALDASKHVFIEKPFAPTCRKPSALMSRPSGAIAG